MCIQVGIDVYIPYQKYQVKRHLSPWCSVACAAAIVHRNHFFHLYQKYKSSESKVKFRQASNCCKRVLEAAKLVYTKKNKRDHDLIRASTPRLPTSLGGDKNLRKVFAGGIQKFLFW